MNHRVINDEDDPEYLEVLRKSLKEASTSNDEDDPEYLEVLRMSLEETNENTLLLFAIDREMDEMNIALDRSLDEHPDFLELQDIAIKESLKYQPEHKVRLFDQSQSTLILSNQYCDLLNRYGNIAKPCLWCEKHKKTCQHFFPSELQFFLKLRTICKLWRNIVDNWLSTNQSIIISYECNCCTHTYTYKKTKENDDNQPWNRDYRSIDKKSPSAFYFNTSEKYNIVLSNGYTIPTAHKICEVNILLKNRAMSKK